METAPTLPREAEIALAVCTEKQRRFVLVFLETSDAAKAVEAATGKPATPKLIRKYLEFPATQRTLRAFWMAAGGSTLVSIPWIVERLRANVERAMQAEPVLDPFGKPTGEYRYEGQVANKALELLGRYAGMFIERKEEHHTHHVLIQDAFSPATADLEDMPAPKLLALPRRAAS